MTGVSLIMPALNEAPSIGTVLSNLPRGVFDEVLVVDNGSTDATAQVAASHGATVVGEPTRGYGRACLAGIARLSPACAIVVFMDADASDDPSDVEQVLTPLRLEQADLVIGARRGPRVERGALAPHQRWGNRLATWLVRLLYGEPCSDLGPFRAIRRDVLVSLDMREPTFGWTVEMQAKALRRRLRVVEVPVAYRPRIGTSKISGSLKNSLLAGATILWKIVRLRVSLADRP
jgi:hypothetical protein